MNPFRALTKNSEPLYDEWAGQFSCQERRCSGHANIARYYRELHKLEWTCQYEHVSRLEDVSE